MKIYLTRHGQTNLNKEKLMQGSIDEPLNETGINQAKETGLKVSKVKFDAVFASPLGRAIDTASLISGVSKENIIIDKRLIEVSFGPYEKKPYSRLGLHMTAFWLLPEVIKPPKGVETISSMVKRSSEFLKEVVEYIRSVQPKRTSLPLSPGSVPCTSRLSARRYKKKPQGITLEAMYHIGYLE